MRKKENEILRNTLDGIRDENLTLNDMYDRWFKIKKVSLKPNSIKLYSCCYELYIKDSIGKLKIKDIRKSDIKEFLIEKSKAYSINTLNSIHTVLHQVFAMACDDEYIRLNPVNNTLSCVPKDNSGKKVNALTIEEQNEFEWYLKEERNNVLFYPIFYTMAWTGMRVGEATSLRWCDIDFNNNLIKVDHCATYVQNIDTHKMELHVASPKTKSSIRTIPLLPNVKEVIFLEKKNLEDACIKCNSNIDGYTDFIFLNSRGCMFKGNELYGTLQGIINRHNKLESRLKLPQFGNHALRHTFATRLFEAGVDVKTIQTILGHSDFGITMNIYTDLTQEHCNSEFEKLKNFFFK